MNNDQIVYVFHLASGVVKELEQDQIFITTTVRRINYHLMQLGFSWPIDGKLYQVQFALTSHDIEPTGGYDHWQRKIVREIKASYNNPYLLGGDRPTPQSDGK